MGKQIQVNQVVSGISLPDNRFYGLNTFVISDAAYAQLPFWYTSDTRYITVLGNASDPTPAVTSLGGNDKASIDAEINALGNAAYVAQPTAGTLAARPSAATFGKGFYFATDDTGGTLYYSNATAWTAQAPGVSAVAFGARVATASITANVTTTSTSYVDATGLSVTWTAVAGALYRVRIKAAIGNTTSTAQATLALTDSANTVLEEFGYTAKSANDNGMVICETDVSPSAGSVTYKGRLKASANTGFVLAGATFPASIKVDRVG